MRSAEEVLGEPLRIGRVVLPNRIVSAPMERNYCDTEGHRLGKRRPEKYGTVTLAGVTVDVDDTARRLGVEAVHFQSNHEGELGVRRGLKPLERLHHRVDVARPGRCWPK
jgi:2,4-dienoyl-CoA reductase-like NADH-dependent reductase (Old Yellow Enzyme family)